MGASTRNHRRLILAAAATTAIAIALALAVPARSQSGCGVARMAEPARRHAHDRPPLAIGDSTMLLALYNLSGIGYEADAHGCRQFPEALALLRARKAASTLPHMVVIALGADGSVSHDDIGRALGLLCCTRLLVLVTPRELGGGSGSDAAVVREEVRRHPDRALLLDWVRYSAGRGDWFQPDGLHLTTAGAIAFTRLLGSVMRYAYPPVPPGLRRRWSSRGRGDPHLEGDRRGAAVAARGGRPRERVPAGAPSPAPPGPGAPAPVPPEPGAPAPVPLRIRASLGQLGYVAATVSGPAGVSVRVGERIHRANRFLAVAALGGAGRVELPRLLQWRCEEFSREIVASTIPPAPAEQALARVRTPSCSRRLAAAVAGGARVGRAVSIRLRDRWGIGGLAVRLCVSPPGARPQCGRWWIHRGQRRRVIEVATARPGGWAITVQGQGGRTYRHLVWVEHPGGRIRVLLAGDSEMQVLDDFLRQDLGPRGVDVTSDARISTGLTKPFFFDWQAHARRQAATLRPDATVMFIGANDGFSVVGSHGPVVCCGSGWSGGYGALVAEMMRTYLRGGAGRVYWFVLPAPRPGSFTGLFNSVNAGIKQAARRFPGRVSLIDAASFFTPGGYRDFMTYHGQGFVIHEPDGVHLSTASDQVAATLVVHQMLADRLIR